MVKRNFKEDPVTIKELMHCYWYAVPNDLIGGWDISNVNKPESQRNPYNGEFEVGCFMQKETAEHLVKIHNVWWEIEVWKTYSSNIHHTYKKELEAQVQSFKNIVKRAMKSLPFDPDGLQARFDRSRMRD